MKIAARILFAGAATLGGLTCLLLVVEERFKVFYHVALSGIAYDENLGWKLKKAHRWTINGANHEKSYVSSNASGFRDIERSIAKPPGRKRIMFLGDSYTAGLHYPNETIFTQRFAQALDQLAAQRNRFEIMNVAVPAWATDQQYL